MKSRAIIHQKYNEPLMLDDIEIPDPKSNEVVVKLFASGICGSQLINLTNPRLSSPELLGHEGTGLIVKKGKDVRHVNEDDHVLISWLPYDANANTEYSKWSSITWNGQKINSIIFTWAQHALMDSQFVSKMDKDLERYTTSILGCAGIAGYGSVMNLVKIKPDDSVVVLGAGGLGILAINAAKNLKARPIIAVDIDDEKLEFSKIFGSTHTINSKNSDFVNKIKEITNGGADFVFDMVGIPELIESTILATKEGVCGYSEGGTIVLAGFPLKKAEISPRYLIMGQRTYKGSRGGGCIAKRDFPKFYEDYRKGTLLLDKAVTKRYKLDQINQAAEDLSTGKILGRAIIEIS